MPKLGTQGMLALIVALINIVLLAFLGVIVIANPVTRVGVALAMVTLAGPMVAVNTCNGCPGITNVCPLLVVMVLLAAVVP